MRKKLIITTSMLLIGFVVLIGVFNKDKILGKSKNGEPQEVAFDNGMKDHLFGKDMYLDSKMDEFNNLKDVEKVTDEIVIAEKISQAKSTILYGREGRIDIAYTLSDFKVKKVISGKKLKENDTFAMLENEAYDQKRNLTYHIGGYNLIQDKKDYLLFLRHSETDPYYIVSGVNYGKVDIKSKETDYPAGLRESKTAYGKELLSEYAQIEKIRSEAKEKYASFF